MRVDLKGGFYMSQVVGSMRRLDETRGAVRMEVVYDVVASELWSALTDPTRLARWIAVVKGDLRVGATVHATFTSTWDGPGRIDVCEAPRHLQVTMEPGTEDEAVIDVVLTAEGARTNLVVEERGLPLNVLYMHGAGWQAHVEDLGRHLSGEGSIWKARWEELKPSYETMSVP